MNTHKEETKTVEEQVEEFYQHMLKSTPKLNVGERASLKLHVQQALHTAHKQGYSEGYTQGEHDFDQTGYKQGHTEGYAELEADINEVTKQNAELHQKIAEAKAEGVREEREKPCGNPKELERINNLYKNVLISIRGEATPEACIFCEEIRSRCDKILTNTQDVLDKD